MILRAVHNSRISAYAVAFLAFLILWARLFFLNLEDIATLDKPSMPLWNLIIDPFFGNSKYSSAILSIVLAFLIAFSVNRTIVKIGLLSQQGMLPFLIYALLSSTFLCVQKLNPIWIFTLFFILGIEQIFLSVGKRKPQINCFNAALLAGIGALFYAKGIFFFALFFLIMGILRILNYKAILASLFGLILPFSFNFIYFYNSDNITLFFNDLQENLFSFPEQYYQTVFSKIYIAIIIIVTLFAIILSFRHITNQKILTRRYLRCFLWMMIIICAVALTPIFSLEIIPVTSLISATLIAFWLDKIKRKKLKESLFYLLVVITIFGQVFLQ